MRFQAGEDNQRHILCRAGASNGNQKSAYGYCRGWRNQRKKVVICMKSKAKDKTAKLCGAGVPFQRIRRI